MPNKASEYVDWAYAHAHNILDLHPAEQHCDDQVSSCSEMKRDLEERLQAGDQNLHKRIKEFELLEKKLTNIETSTKQHHDDQVKINSQINDKIIKMQSNFSDLQCQISQLITRVDETDKKLGQLNKQFETRNDEIMQTMSANGKKDINEVSEKLKASQVKVDELKQNLSDLQTQLNQSIEEMKKGMAKLSKVHPPNNATPSGNQLQPAFNETMDTLRRKLDHLTDSLIPKEASERRRSIMQSHRKETRQSYRARPQSLLLESSLSETMDSPVIQRSYSATSTGSSGLGTLPHQQSGESLPTIGGQNISLSLLNPSTFLKGLSLVGTNAASERRHPVIQSHRNETRQNYRPCPQSLLLESKSMDSLEHPSTSSTSSGRDSLSHQPSLESLLEIGVTEQLSQGPLPEICITEQQDIGTNEFPQMRRQRSTPALLASQQSNEISFESQRIIEVVWAMGDLVDQLKNLAENFVDNTSTSDTYKNLTTDK